MKTIVNIVMTLLVSATTFAQSDLEKVIRGGEVLLSGLTIYKSTRSERKKDSKFVETVCIKNKLSDRVTFRLTGKDDEDNVIVKELVIPKDGKECLLQVPKGIYAYEFVRPDMVVHRKGEYKFDDDIIMTIKDE